MRKETDDCVRMMFGRVTTSDGTYTDIRRSRAFRQENLAASAAAEAAAPTERDKAKVRHYMRGIEEVIEALRRKEAMILDLYRPFGQPGLQGR